MRRKQRIVIIAIVAAALLLLTLSALDTRLRVVSYTVSDARIETPVLLLTSCTVIIVPHLLSTSL